MMDDVYEELRSLKRRVEELENESQIRAVLNSYGPAVDSNDPEKTSRLYAEDCTVDIDGAWFAHGREETKNIVTSDAHQSILPNSATASGYATIFVRRDGEVNIWRQSYQCWELVKRDNRWQVLKRVSRSTGREDGQALLQVAL
jgi:hypothetical protein